MLFIFSLFVSLGLAQQSTSFDLAYDETIQCLVKAKNLESRKNCYVVCEKARVERVDFLSCSRLKMKTEEEHLDERYLEEGKSSKHAIGMAKVQCQLLNFRAKEQAEVYECMAEQYMKEEVELITAGN